VTRFRSFLRRHALLVFFVLAYSISWALWLPALSERFGAYRTGRATLLLFLGGFGPFLSALLLTWVEHGYVGAKKLLGRLVLWRVDFSWYLVALYGVPGYGLVASVLCGVASPREALAQLPIVLFALPFSVVTRFLIVGPLGEELGWRGYALPRMLAKHKPLKSSAALGILWAFWHAPLMLVPEWRGSVSAGAFLFIYPLSLAALTVIFTWVSLGTNGSLLVVMILHASYNATLYYLDNLFQLGRVESWTAMGATAAFLWAFVFVLVLMLGAGLRPHE
jgi:membrane protease YdiL (CAAX protease family)